MSVKKSKEFRFAWQDAAGKLRAVVIQAEHAREGEADTITLNVTGDGVPIQVRTFDEPDKRVVKTSSRM